MMSAERPSCRHRCLSRGRLVLLWGVNPVDVVMIRKVIECEGIEPAVW